MATLTFTFDTGAVTTAEILNAFATRYGYQTTVPDPNAPEPPPGQMRPLIPNPETKAVFARRMVREYIIGIVRDERHRAAKATAVAAVVPPIFTD